MKIDPSQVTFELFCLPEETPIEGNVMVSGDDAGDREAELWVIAQLNGGNEWAWCCLELRATWGDLTTSDYLGCVSVRNEKEAREIYEADMRSEALTMLQAKVDRMLAALGVSE
jgi:hypothetical protein